MAAAVQAAFHPGDTRCVFDYTVVPNATNDRKRTSVAAQPGGDIRIAPDHELVTAVGHLLPAPVAGRVSITMHLVEFLITSSIIIHQDLDAVAPNWFIKLAWLSALWAAMLNAGMESGRAVTGKVQMTMHLVEYLVMPFTTINADLDIKPPNWFINLTWLSAL